MGTGHASLVNCTAISLIVVTVIFLNALWAFTSLSFTSSNYENVTESPISEGVDVLFRKRLFGNNVVEYSQDEKNTNVRYTEIMRGVPIKFMYNGNFSVPNGEMCDMALKPNLTLLIVITTAVPHFELRQAIRMTWGHFAQRLDTTLTFLIGDEQFPQYNASTLTNLENEMNLYNDFIVGSFFDSYRNLTLKTIHMLDWVTRFCSGAKYLLKTDDDVFINVPGIINFINAVQESESVTPKIYGHVFTGHYPIRDETHKHFIPWEMYPYDIPFPNLTSGPAYLMNTKIVQPLFETALNFPLFPLEDTLVTGFAADKLRIPKVDMSEFLNEVLNPITLNGPQLHRIFAGMTNGSASQMHQLWTNYLTGQREIVFRMEKKLQRRIR